MTTLAKSPVIAHPAPLRAVPHAFGPIVAAAPEVPLRTFDSEMRMIPGVHIGLRSMLVDAAGEQLLVSPVGTREEAAAVTASDRPVTLVAPSLLHHKFMRDAIGRYQPDELWGPPGLAQKQPELGGVRTFGRDAWPYGDVLEVQLIEGAPKRNEVMFFHRRTKTLYTADIVFNVQRVHGLLSPIAFRMMGIYERFAMPTMWKRWVVDRAAFTRSIERVLAWNFERIVVAHGDIVEPASPELLRAAIDQVGLLG